MPTNFTIIEADGGATPISPRSCTVSELRDMLQEIHTLTEKLSVALKSELHYNHRMFLTLTDTIPDGIIITDVSGNIRVTSSKALELLSITEELGLNGTNILGCFPSISRYENAGSKVWAEAKFVFGTRTTALDVLVSKIELHDGSTAGLGANCIILLKSHVESEPEQTADTYMVDRYTLTASVTGSITYISPNLQKLLISRPDSTLDLRHLIGSTTFDKFVAGNLDIQNVDVQVLEIEIADLDIRPAVVYKTNVVDSTTKEVSGYSLTLFDISDACRPTTRLDKSALAFVRVTPWPSILIRSDGCKAVYCNKGVLSKFGIYPTDILNQSLFTVLFGHGSEAQELEQIVRQAVTEIRQWSGPVRVLHHGQYAKCELKVDVHPGALCSLTFKEY